MTLIVNEIYYDPKHKDATIILCAADKRSENGQAYKDERKLFKHARFDAAVSYFGLVDTGAGWEMADLLASWTANDSSATLRDFAESLVNQLNALVPKHVLRSQASGIHLCGLNERRVPEFWFIRNIKHMRGLEYHTFEDAYWKSEELSEVHQKAIFDVKTADYTSAFVAWFANGDLRTHRPAWLFFDEFDRHMQANGLASPPESASDLEKRLRWKMLAIGEFYDIIANEQIVGGGVDTFILPHDGK